MKDEAILVRQQYKRVKIVWPAESAWTEPILSGYERSSAYKLQVAMILHKFNAEYIWSTTLGVCTCSSR